MTTAAIGVIVGPLSQVHADRIVIGGKTIYLRSRVAWAPGMHVKVTYAEQNGRAEAVSLTLLETFHSTRVMTRE